MTAEQLDTTALKQMTYAPTNPVDIPPYQLQGLFLSTEDTFGDLQICCGQAFGPEIYVGCSNGELIRFALQAEDPNKPESYSLLSRQTVPLGKPVDEIVLVPCLGRAFVLSDRILYFYTLPSLDPVSLNIVKPIRHVVTFAVDHRDLQRPSILPNTPTTQLESVNFCIIKRTGVAMYVMRERLNFLKEIPLQGVSLACRLGHRLCTADKEFYNMVDLEAASLIPIIPISQAPDSDVSIKPSITVVSDNEFLILSWTGTTTIGLFITGEGDPVRGTLEWPCHPEAVCLDYPYITTLLPNDTIEIHSIETQTIVQVIGADIPSTQTTPTGQLEQQQRSRISLVSSLAGYLVPSVHRSKEMRKTQVRLLRAQEPLLPT